MDELLKMLSDAVAGQNWVVVVVVSVLVLLSIVALVLKVMGKDVPIIGTLLDLGKGIVKVLPAKKVEPVDPAKEGIAGVVEVKDESKK